MEDLTVVFIFRKKFITDLYESKICYQTYDEKKLYNEKLWLPIYWPCNQNRPNLMIQDGQNIFGFYSSKNDAAVKLRIKVNTYLPLDYQLFYKLNLRTVFAYDCSCNITILLGF